MRPFNHKAVKKDKQIKGVFIMGRQHSGNTFLTRILGNTPNFFMDDNENSWFEQVPVLEKIASLEERVIHSTKHLLKGKPKLAQQFLPKFQTWAKSNPQAGIYELFLSSMETVTRTAQKENWVLKATSYIFYAEEILNNCPNVKLVYIMRNPLDLTASTKKRNPRGLDWLISTNLAWRRGVAIAEQLAQKYEGRFLIVKYEQLVEGEREFERIEQFLDIPSIQSYQEMPVVNTSDDPYATTTKKGLVKNRVYYFKGILSSGQIFFALKLAGGIDYVKNWYSDMPLPSNITLFNKLQGFKTFIGMSWLFAKKHFNIFSVYQLNRSWRRLMIMLSGKR
ncbi:MAG: sulfotransferase [Bacteroidota bacterium]